MTAYGTALVLSVLTVLAMVYLLRSRRIREKYAGAWLTLALGVLAIGAFPEVLGWLADRLGVETPINLLFLGSGIILLIVSVQFSVEFTSLEEETRTLAEEVALLRHDVEQVLPALRGATDEAPALADLVEPEELAVDRRPADDEDAPG